MLLFLMVCLISFLGSVHPGAVNVAVILTTLGQSQRAGVWLALGGSLPEIAYSGLAAGGLMRLPDGGRLVSGLSLLAVPVLLGAGLAAFRQKPVSVAVLPVKPGARPFWKGMTLAGLNPQLLPFWSAVWLWLRGQSRVPMDGAGSVWLFAVGTAVGAFALLLVCVWLADRYRWRVLPLLNGRQLNRLTGVVFIGMAATQVVRLLTH